MIPIPEWVQAVRLLLTFLVTAAAGVHAFYLFQTAGEQRQKSSAGESLAVRLRWIFLLYAGLFLFVSVLNFSYLLITVALKYPGGPFKLGTLSLILVVSYAALVFGSGRRMHVLD